MQASPSPEQQDYYLACSNQLKNEFEVQPKTIQIVWSALSRQIANALLSGELVRVPFFGTFALVETERGQVCFTPSKGFLERFKAKCNAQSLSPSSSGKLKESSISFEGMISEYEKRSKKLPVGQQGLVLTTIQVHRIVKAISLLFGQKLARGKESSLQIPGVGLLSSHQRWVKFRSSKLLPIQSTKLSEITSGTNTAVRQPVHPPTQSPRVVSPRVRNMVDQKQNSDPVRATFQNEQMSKWLWNEFRALDNLDRGVIRCTDVTKVVEKVVNSYCKRYDPSCSIHSLSKPVNRLIQEMLVPYIVNEDWISYRKLMQSEQPVHGRLSSPSKYPVVYEAAQHVQEHSDQHRKSELMILSKFRDWLFTAKLTLLDLYRSCNTLGTNIVTSSSFRDTLHQLGFKCQSNELSQLWKWITRNTQDSSTCDLVTWQEFECGLSENGASDPLSRAVLAISNAFQSKIALRQQFRNWMNAARGSKKAIRINDKKHGIESTWGLPLEEVSHKMRELPFVQLSASASLQLARITDSNGDQVVTEEEFFARFANTTDSSLIDTNMIPESKTSPLMQLRTYIAKNHLVVTDLIRQLDQNQDGYVTTSEFVAGLLGIFPTMNQAAAEDIASRCSQFGTPDLVSVNMFSALLDGRDALSINHVSVGSPICSPTRNTRKTLTFEHTLQNLRKSVVLQYPTRQSRDVLYRTWKLTPNTQLKFENFEQMLSEVAMHLGISISPNTVSQLVEYADLNRDGLISQSEVEALWGFHETNSIEHKCSSSVPSQVLIENNHVDWALHLCRAIELLAERWSLQGWFNAMSGTYQDTITPEQFEEGIREYVDVISVDVYTSNWLQHEFLNSTIGTPSDKPETTFKVTFETLQRVLDIHLGIVGHSGTERKASSGRQSETYLNILKKWGRASAETYLRKCQQREETHTKWVLSRLQKFPKVTRSSLVADESKLKFTQGGNGLNVADRTFVLLSDRAFQHRISLVELFEFFDVDRDGFVSCSELRDGLGGKNQAINHVIGLKTSEDSNKHGDFSWIPEAFNRFESSCGKFISLEQFLELLAEPVHDVGWEMPVFDCIIEFGRKHELCPHKTFSALLEAGRKVLAKSQQSKLSRWTTTQQHAFETNDPCLLVQGGHRTLDIVCNCHNDVDVETNARAQSVKRLPTISNSKNGTVIGEIPDMETCALFLQPSLSRKQKSTTESKTLSMTGEELLHGLEVCCGIHMLHRQLVELVRMLDMDGNGRVSCNEFIQRVTPKQYTWGSEENNCRVVIGLLLDQFNDDCGGIVNELFRKSAHVSVEQFKSFVLETNAGTGNKQLSYTHMAWNMIVRKLNYQFKISKTQYDVSEFESAIGELYMSGHSCHNDTGLNQNSLSFALSRFNSHESFLREVSDASFVKGITFTSLVKRIGVSKPGTVNREEFSEAITWLCPSVRATHLEKVWLATTLENRITGREVVALFNASNQSVPLEWELKMISGLRNYLGASLGSSKASVAGVDRAIKTCTGLLRVIASSVEGSSTTRLQQLNSISVAAMRQCLWVTGLAGVGLRQARRIVWVIRALAWLDAERISTNQGKETADDRARQTHRQKFGASTTDGSRVHSTRSRGVVHDATRFDTLPILKGTDSVSISDALRVLGPWEDHVQGVRPNSVLRDEAGLIYGWRVVEQIQRRYDGQYRNCWNECFSVKRGSKGVNAEEFHHGMVQLFCKDDKSGRSVPLETTTQQLFHMMGASYSINSNLFELRVESFCSFCKRAPVG